VTFPPSRWRIRRQETNECETRSTRRKRTRGESTRAGANRVVLFEPAGVDVSRSGQLRRGQVEVDLPRLVRIGVGVGGNGDLGEADDGFVLVRRLDGAVHIAFLIGQYSVARRRCRVLDKRIG